MTARVPSPTEPPQVCRRLQLLRGWSHDQGREVFFRGAGTSGSAGVRARGRVRLAVAAIQSFAGKIGCSAETLRNWVRLAERDSGRRAGLTTDDRQCINDLEREDRALRRADELSRKAAAFFAQAEPGRKPR